MVLHSVTGVLIRREKLGHRDSDIQGGRYVKTEAEIGGTCVQAKERPSFVPAISRSWERDKELSLRASRRIPPCWHLDFGFLASRAVR